jgi:hypothetical protein
MFQLNGLLLGANSLLEKRGREIDFRINNFNPPTPFSKGENTIH